MSNRKMKVVKVMRPRQNSRKQNESTRRGSATDSALALRPEYAGQPTMKLPLFVLGGSLVTTVTTGVATANVAISSAGIGSFSTRFAGFSEFRIVKAIAKYRNFSSVNPGIMNMWFSEDDAAAPTANKAGNSVCKRFSLSDVDKVHTLSFVPHDPAQQTWTLVSSGAPTIGYLKLYTDNANYGSPISVTAIGLLELDYVVQFRGLI